MITLQVYPVEKKSDFTKGSATTLYSATILPYVCFLIILCSMLQSGTTLPHVYFFNNSMLPMIAQAMRAANLLLRNGFEMTNTVGRTGGEPIVVMALMKPPSLNNDLNAVSNTALFTEPISPCTVTLSVCY